jgi:hypothetical protein
MSGKLGAPRQRTLWENPVANPVPAVKLAMAEAIKATSLSRDELTDDMNRLARLAGLRLRVSKAVLDKWLNPAADGYQPPLAGLFLFCQAVGSGQPLAGFGQAFSDVRLVSIEEYELLEWAKSEKQLRQTKRRVRQLAHQAGVE